MAKTLKAPEERRCKVCAAEFPASAHNAKYCSGACRKKGGEAYRAARQRIRRSCIACKQTVPQAQSRYCSRECQMGHWKESGKASTFRRAWRLMKLYGLSVEDFDALLARQGFGCAICGSPDPNSKYSWNVDHDHDTGATRGLLCNPCNTGLGHFADNAQRLRAAASYLETHATIQAALAAVA